MPNGECRYFLTDQVDSVNVVLNDKGDAVTRTEYKPYGETWVQEGDKTNRPKFNSQELDPETGYYFYNARYYEAEIGRFITADNVIDGEYSTQGWNRFSYVKNNPVRYKDPSGHSKKDAEHDAMASVGITSERYYLNTSIRKGIEENQIEENMDYASMGKLSPVGKQNGEVLLTSPWPRWMANPNKKHGGIDLAGKKDDVVTNIKEGVISDIVRGNGNIVGYIAVKVSDDTIYYEHVKADQNVKKNDKVIAGQKLGILDDSGKDSGHWDGWHLHFQVNDGDEDKSKNNPYQFILNSQPNLFWKYNGSSMEADVKKRHPEIYDKMRK